MIVLFSLRIEQSAENGAENFSAPYTIICLHFVQGEAKGFTRAPDEKRPY
jgi:hypothetical protein